MAKLYPCVVLGDFSVEKLADTVTAEQKGRWYTTDNNNWIPSLSRTQSMLDRKSLLISAGAFSAPGDKVLRGIAGTDVDSDDVVNAFGNAVDGFTWATKLGCWLYCTTDYYDVGDPDEFVMIMTNNSTDIICPWPSTFDQTNKWIWIENAPSSGSFDSNGYDIEQWGFAATAAFTASCCLYVNAFVVFSDTLSGEGNPYNANTGLEFVAENITFSNNEDVYITGLLRGTDYNEKSYQLHQMVTKDLFASKPIRWPRQRYQSMSDCNVLKTYLLYVDFVSRANTYKQIRMPIIIDAVTTEWAAPAKESVPITIEGKLFAGV